MGGLRRLHDDRGRPGVGGGRGVKLEVGEELGNLLDHRYQLWFLLSTKVVLAILSLISDWLICFLRPMSLELSDSSARAISSRLLSLAARVVLSTIT